MWRARSRISNESRSDVLAEFPREHPYRSVVETPARFASDLGGDLPPFALARLHGAWTRGVTELVRGEADLVDFLVDRVRAHGGEAKLGERASHIAARFGKATGVRIEGDDGVTGVQFVVTDQTSSSLLELASDFRPSRRALDARPARRGAASRGFVTSFLVRDEGAPDTARHRGVPAAGRQGSSRRVVHLQKSPDGSPVPGTTLLVAETFVGPRSASTRSTSRAMPALRL